MIKAVELWNFQSHKHSRVEFHKGVNAIVGLSDSGKTAILRALNWAINNFPTGDEFQSWWGGDTRVTIELENGVSVSRIRTKSDNRYELCTNTDAVDECVEVFRAFGQDVPEEIKKAFNLNNINLQHQMDGPFLLANSPGDVARILNKVVNLDVIDTAVSNIRKVKMDTDKTLKFETNRQEDLKAQLAEYEYLDEVEAKVSAAEQLCASRNHVNKQMKGLTQSIESMERIQTNLTSIKAVLKADKCVCGAIKSLEQWKAIHKQMRRLHEIINTYTERSANLESAKLLMGAESLFEKLEGKQRAARELHKQSAALALLIQKINGAEQLWKDKEEDIKQLSKEFDEAMPAICPLCLQPISRRAK